MATKELQAHYGLLLGLVPPWTVLTVDLDTNAKRLMIQVEYPKGNSVLCPVEGCGRRSGIKDHCNERTWRHLDTMQFETVIKCRVPRCDCAEHGAKTIAIPWAGPRSQFTLMFEHFAIDVLLMARSLSKAQELLRISWDQAQRIQELAVERGLAMRELDELTYVGMDEKSFRRGQSYISTMTDLDQGRVLEVIEGRDQVSADQLWKMLPQEQQEQIQAVAVDMWDPYMAAARENVPHADIVHDKFHVAQYLSKAVDGVRKKEHRDLQENNCDILKGSKYVWLANPKNWNEKQRAMFEEFKGQGLKVGRAWAIKEAFGEFWNYTYEGPALKFFARWYFWATHSRLKPVIDTAKTLKRHLDGLVTYLRHRITNAVTEGLNSKIQTLKSNARGFRNFENYRVSILFHCGKLHLYP